MTQAAPHFLSARSIHYVCTHTRLAGAFTGACRLGSFSASCRLFPAVSALLIKAKKASPFGSNSWFLVNVTLHSTVTSQNVAFRGAELRRVFAFAGEIAGKLCRATLHRGPDLLCRIPVLRCVFWDLRRRLLRGNARHWERAVPVDPASEVHGSRNRQETSNRAYEQCIILESQQ